jgi:hypothetical protein
VAALTMEVVPPLTADFSLRYVVPTIPVVSLAAALAFARPLRATALAAAGDAAGRAGDDADQGPPADGERAVVTAAQQRPAETTDQGGNTTS